VTRIYADFEPADDAGLSDIIESNGAAFTQTGAAAMPGRGSFGASYTSIGDTPNDAFGVRTVAITIGEGESVFLSVDFRVRSWTKVAAYYGNSIINLRDIDGPDDFMGWLLFDAAGDCNVMVRIYSDALQGYNTPAAAVQLGRWHRATMQVRRASTSSSADGYAALWMDGRYVGKTSDIDNYHRIDDDMDEIWIGNSLGTPGATSEIDVDNVICSLGAWTPPARIDTPGVGCIARAANLAGFGSVGVRRRHAAI
jgi:hypothetical protein